jgi:ComF family protein
MELFSCKKFLLNTFFPQFCLGCNKEGKVICPNCFFSIEISEYQYCPFCKKPQRVLEKGTCSLHRKNALNGLFSAVSYKTPLAQSLIKNFKYEPFLKILAEPLASLIVTHFLLSKKWQIFYPLKKSLFVSVPLINFRKRWRGYNQAEEIAKILSNFFKAPMESDSLIKIKKTESQVELTGKEREKNIKDAFKVKNPEIFKGKKIFIVDDVFTTGATLEETARVLKNAGAKEVWGIVVARE